MKLIVLGSGTGVIRLDRGSPGYLLKSKRHLFLIESGAGTLTRILQAGFKLNDIDAIFYTHIHPDHVTDLVPFLFASKYGVNLRRKKLTVVGGPGFKRFFKDLSKAYRGWLIPKKYSLVIQEMGEGKLKIGDVRILASKPNHIPESVSFRFEENRRCVVFSGDTDFSGRLIDLAQDADLLVLECSFPNQMKVRGHLVPSEAGLVASLSHAKKLLLTHFYPPCDAQDILKTVRPLYQGKVTLAKDGMEIKL